MAWWIGDMRRSKNLTSSNFATNFLFKILSESTLIFRKLHVSYVVAVDQVTSSLTEYQIDLF